MILETSLKRNDGVINKFGKGLTHLSEELKRITINIATLGKQQNKTNEKQKQKQTKKMGIVYSLFILNVGERKEREEKQKR